MTAEAGSADDAKEIVEKTIERIKDAAKTEKRRSQWLRWSNNLFSFAAAILGVGAPTFATYFLQTSTGKTWLKITAIVIVAFAGATTALLNTFRWGSRYGKSALAEISLQELASSTQLQLLEFEKGPPNEIREKLHLLNHDSQKKMFEILRSVVQNEAAVFSNAPEELKRIAQRSDPSGKRKTSKTGKVRKSNLAQGGTESQ
jgi:hypothetical protein